VLDQVLFQLGNGGLVLVDQFGVGADEELGGLVRETLGQVAVVGMAGELALEGRQVVLAVGVGDVRDELGLLHRKQRIYVGEAATTFADAASTSEIISGRAASAFHLAVYCRAGTLYWKTSFIASRSLSMLRYKAGYKYVTSGVHAQVLDFPAAITWGADLIEARQALMVALVDVAEAAMESGQALPVPDPTVANAEMDIEEPIYLHVGASSEVREVPEGVVA
jgi:hypothetical protein